MNVFALDEDGDGCHLQLFPSLDSFYLFSLEGEL